MKFLMGGKVVEGGKGEVDGAKNVMWLWYSDLMLR